MNIKNIELGNLSHYRGELMGVAILFIILFHVDLPRLDTFFGLRRMGNVGVDIFLFLSGMGLWYSWMKQPSARHFFMRRYLRIYPSWLIMACLYYLPRFQGGSDPMKWIDLLGDIGINWGFWLHDELTFWYIPATMMLYCFAPAYMELIKRHPAFRWLPVLMIMWCVAVQYILPIHNAVGHIEIFWSRVPIFFIGINMGEVIRKKTTMEGGTLWLIIIFFVVALSSCLYLEQVRHGRFPLFLERMLYIPLTVTSCILLCYAFKRLPARINRILVFLGGISLEIYLIHAQFVLKYITPLHLGYWPSVLLCILVSVPLAWMLSKIVERISGFILKWK